MGHPGSYLLLQAADVLLILGVILLPARVSLLVPLQDAALELHVGLLQSTHLVQVGGQALIEVLHGLLPIATKEGAASSGPPRPSRGQAAWGGEGKGDADAPRTPMDAGSPGEAPRPAPATSGAREGARGDLAEAVAGAHGPICVWGGAGLCSAPWHRRTEPPQTALDGFMPSAVGVPFSDNCTNKIVSLCNMCFLLVNPGAPRASTHAVVV